MRIIRWLVLLFILVPLIEIYVLVKVGQVIGAWPTVTLLLIMAILGLGVIRLQGFMTWRRATTALAEGKLPAMALLEGVVALIGGVLLLLPGFISDVIGLLCLVPPLRRSFLRWLLRHAIITPRPAKPAAGPRTLEGDFHRDDDPRFPRQ